MSNQHIRRLAKEGKVGLTDGVDHRKTDENSYLYTDTALAKFLEYNTINHKGRRKKK